MCDYSLVGIPNTWPAMSRRWIDLPANLPAISTTGEEAIGIVAVG